MSGGQLNHQSANQNYGTRTTPPTGSYVMIAQVIKKYASSYEALMYWNIGNGVTQIGTTEMLTSSQVSTWGQCGSQCLLTGAPSGNQRYDGIGILDFCNNVPQSAGDIYFDEVRLYSGSMTASQLSTLTPTSTVATNQLAGWWTFDSYGTCGALSNKLSGVTWDPLALSSEGAALRDGKLLLSSCVQLPLLSWRLGQASTTLRTTVTPFSNKTVVLWLSVNKQGDADDVASVFTLQKSTSSNQPCDTINWAGQFYSSIQSPAGSVMSAYPYAANPPTIPCGQMVKLAAVWSSGSGSQYSVTYYLDRFDGNGLQPYGNPLLFDNSYLSSFGDAGNDTVIFGSMGEILAGKTAGVSIEEARVYNAALTQTTIAGLVEKQRPVPLAANLVGEWPFDSRGGTDGTNNKAPDSSWNPMALSANGTAIDHGMLHLSAYANGSSWSFGQASTSLLSSPTAVDLPAYRDKTYVMWLSLDKWDAGDSVELLKLAKAATSNQPNDRICWDSGQFAVKTRNSAGSECVGYPFASNPPAIPAGRTVKLVAVWNDTPGSTFSVTLYLDLMDGTGLQPYGSTLNFDYSYLTSYGDADNDTLTLASSVVLTGNTLGVSYDDVRIYNRALTQAEIAGLSTHQPSEFLSRNGASLYLGGMPYRAFGGDDMDLFSLYAPLYADGNYTSTSAQQQHIVTAISDAQNHGHAVLSVLGVRVLAIGHGAVFQ